MFGRESFAEFVEEVSMGERALLIGRLRLKEYRETMELCKAAIVGRPEQAEPDEKGGDDSLCSDHATHSFGMTLRFKRQLSPSTRLP